MRPMVRPSVPTTAAATVLVASGLIGAAPSTAAHPGVATHDVRLTATDPATFFDEMRDMFDKELTFNAISRFVEHNQGLVADQAALINDIVKSFPAEDRDVATFALQHLFEANNMLADAGQASFLGTLGVRTIDPEVFNQSLLFPGEAAAIESEFGGLQGAVGHGLVLAAGLAELLSGKEPAGLDDLLVQLLDDVRAFNTNLISAQFAFNAELLAGERALLDAMFGASGHELARDIFVRGFNAFNMQFDVQQQSVNGLLGLTNYDPQALTASLLLPTQNGDYLNDGSIGGLFGVLNQNLALLGSALIAKDAGELIGMGGDADDAAFFAAIENAFTTLAGGPFGDVLSTGLQPLFADIGDIFAALW